MEVGSIMSGKEPQGVGRLRSDGMIEWLPEAIDSHKLPDEEMTNYPPLPPIDSTVDELGGWASLLVLLGFTFPLFAPAGNALVAMAFGLAIRTQRLGTHIVLHLLFYALLCVTRCASRDVVLALLCGRLCCGVTLKPRWDGVCGAVSVVAWLGAAHVTTLPTSWFCTSEFPMLVSPALVIIGYYGGEWLLMRMSNYVSTLLLVLTFVSSLWVPTWNVHLLMFFLATAQALCVHFVLTSLPSFLFHLPPLTLIGGPLLERVVPFWAAIIIAFLVLPPLVRVPIAMTNSR